jgi:hypothetical protein
MLGKLLIPLFVFALLLGAAAQAAPAASSPAPVALEEEIELEGGEEAGEAAQYREFEAEVLGEFEAEEEEEEGEIAAEEEEAAEEECEEATEEFEEGEIDREELEEDCERQRKRSQPGPGGVLPEMCVVRSFESSAVADPDRSTVELTVRYTTFRPTNATIAYDAQGKRIDTARRHLGDHGAIRLHEHLGDSAMKRLSSSHQLDVQIGIPSTPASCQRYYDDSARIRLR